MTETETWLIYHPKRKTTKSGNFIIHHDDFGGNEDPYLWNEKFLHTYCHITQLTNVKGQINFWVSGDSYPSFTKLYCDCVFVIDEKLYWSEKNHIDRSDVIVDNDQTFEHHYKWANEGHHKLKRRQRYTLKAHKDKSFQPQGNQGNLLDILPFLNSNGITTEELIRSMTSKRGSRPLKLDGMLGQKLYDYLFKHATLKLFGSQLANLHPNKTTVDKNTTQNINKIKRKACS
jgi:hypothetical protein